MGVYVGSLMQTTPSKRWPYKAACHMTADTGLELDEMAAALGLTLRYKQDALTCREHYDLTASKRKQAIELGAQEIDWRTEGKRTILRCVREGG